MPPSSELQASPGGDRAQSAAAASHRATHTHTSRTQPTCPHPLNCRQALEATARARDQIAAASQALEQQVHQLQGQLLGLRALQQAHEEVQVAAAAAHKEATMHQQVTDWFCFVALNLFGFAGDD